MRKVGTGIIVKDGKILIGQRPEGKPLAGYWEFPGGKIEAGETIEQCLKREIREELSVEIAVGEHLTDVYYHGENGDFDLHVFFARITSAQEPVANVHKALAWVAPNELDEYNFPPADVDIVQKLKSHKW